MCETLGIEKAILTTAMLTFVVRVLSPLNVSHKDLLIGKKIQLLDLRILNRGMMAILVLY